MTQTTSSAARTRPCLACLGTTSCWECTGNGCGACASTGVCPDCRLVPVPRQSGDRME